MSIGATGHRTVRAERWKYEIVDRPEAATTETVRWMDQAILVLVEIAPRQQALKIPFERPTLYPAAHHQLVAAFVRWQERQPDAGAHTWRLRTKADEGFLYAWLEPRPEREPNSKEGGDDASAAG